MDLVRVPIIRLTYEQVEALLPLGGALGGLYRWALKRRAFRDRQSPYGVDLPSFKVTATPHEASIDGWAINVKPEGATPRATLIVTEAMIAAGLDAVLLLFQIILSSQRR